jgi:hypothetical protein
MFPARLATHKHAHTILCDCLPTSKPDSQINRQKSMQFARTKIMLSRAGGGSDSSVDSNVPAPKAPCPLSISEPHPSFVSRPRKAALRVRRAKDLSTPTTKASGRDLARFHVLPGVALVWRLPLSTLLNCTGETFCRCRSTNRAEAGHPLRLCRVSCRRQHMRCAPDQTPPRCRVPHLLWVGVVSSTTRYMRCTHVKRATFVRQERGEVARAARCCLPCFVVRGALFDPVDGVSSRRPPTAGQPRRPPMCRGGGDKP